MSEQCAAVASADWVFTRYGILHHIAAPRVPGEQRRTLCGRFAFKHADAPVGGVGGRACDLCTQIATPGPVVVRAPVTEATS